MEKTLPNLDGGSELQALTEEVRNGESTYMVKSCLFWNG